MLYKIKGKLICTIIVPPELSTNNYWYASIVELGKERPRYVTNLKSFKTEKEAKQWMGSSFIKHFPQEIFKG